MKLSSLSLLLYLSGNVKPGVIRLLVFVMKFSLPAECEMLLRRRLKAFRTASSFDKL